ncbi:MAG: apolipoprotein N-acyltransferase [Actinobacteria bacterium]|nr:apolipoprotein N-acyltransferase [Actinomycetota bacterium]
MPDKTTEISLLREAVAEKLEPYRRPVLAIVSGISLALAFPYASIWPLAFIGVTPLLMAVDGAGPYAAPLLGWLAGAVFFSILAYWLSVFGVSVLILLVAVMALYLALFTSGARWALKNLPLRWRLFSIPALWVSIEYLRSFGPYSFPWGTIGESIKSLPLMQLASLIGGFGLSFLVAVVGVLLYEVWRRGFRASLSIIALLMVIVLAWYGWGAYRAGRLNPPETTRIALLQGNVPQDVKLNSANVGDQKRLYLDMTGKAAKERPDLIIWPESAVPDEIRNYQDYLADVQRAAKGSTVIVGAFDRDAGGIYNAAFLLGDDDLSVYRKIHLVPWGEFTPLRFLSSRVNSLAGLGEDQTPGRDLVPLAIDRRRMATVICFESAYSRQMAAMVRAGARVGLVITNDGWFGETSAADQHFELARFRAVENGIYVAQAANTGITGIIDPKGRVIEKTRLNERTILRGAIGYSVGTTFYAKFADVIPFVHFGIVGAAIASHIRRRRKSNG